MKKGLLVIIVLMVVGIIGIIYSQWASSPPSHSQSSVSDQNQSQSASAPPTPHMERFVPVMNRLIESMNSHDFPAIFQSFAPSMQNSIPLPKTTEFFTGLARDYGRASTLGEKHNFPPSKVICPVSFERGVLEMTISLDAHDKIIELVFHPQK